MDGRSDAAKSERVTYPQTQTEKYGILSFPLQYKREEEKVEVFTVSIYHPNYPYPGSVGSGISIVGGNYETQYLDSK
jgi:hypothetical protein